MFRFFVCLVLVFSLFGCENNRMAQDALIDVLSETEMSGSEEVSVVGKDIPVCQVGDILMPGQACLDGDTDGMFMVLENGNAKYTSVSGMLFESTDTLDTAGATLNDVVYSFRASKLSDGGWKVLPYRKHLPYRKQLTRPLILSVIGVPVSNEVLVPVNDSMEWFSHGPGIWEKTSDQDILEFNTIPNEFKQYVNWVRSTNDEVTRQMSSNYPHWFYSHAESTIVWNVSGYDVIRFEGFYLLPSYQARRTEENDGNVVITWYADDVSIYSSGRTSWEEVKATTTSEAPGFYKYIIDMNFDIPQGTNQLKLHVSNSDDGFIYDHFAILNPKLYTTEPVTND